MVFAEIHRKPGNVDDFPVFINKYGPNLADSRRHFPHRIGFADVLEKELIRAQYTNVKE